jgi:hypothetical protein
MPTIKYDDLGNPAMTQEEFDRLNTIEDDGNRSLVPGLVEQEEAPDYSTIKWAIEDPIVVRVVDRIAERSEEGMKKYGVSMERDDISIVGWIDHTIEELLDASVYLERLRVGMVKIEEEKRNPRWGHLV